MPVPTASIFFVLDLIYSDFAAKNLDKKNTIPFSCVWEFLHFIPFTLDFVDILFTLVKLSFEVIDDIWDFAFNFIEILVMKG